MNTQITEMAKRFMIENCGPPPSQALDQARARWDESLGLVILAMEFALNEGTHAKPIREISND